MQKARNKRDVYLCSIIIRVWLDIDSFEEQLNGELLVVDIPEFLLVRVVELVARNEQAIGGRVDERGVKCEKEGTLVVVLGHVLVRRVEHYFDLLLERWALDLVDYHLAVLAREFALFKSILVSLKSNKNRTK